MVLHCIVESISLINCSFSFSPPESFKAARERAERGPKMSAKPGGERFTQTGGERERCLIGIGFNKYSPINGQTPGRMISYTFIINMISINM